MASHPTHRRLSAVAIALAAGLAASTASAAPPARDPPRPLSVRVGSIPRQFWGTWTEKPDLCGQPSLDDSILVVKARELDFYESYGAVKSVVIHNDLAITVTSSFSGEGETWNATNTYVLSGSRLDLTMSDRTGKLGTRHRCH